MSSHSADRDRLVLSMSINAFGSAVTFTGLPTWVAIQTGDPKQASVLFVTQTVASLGVGLLGGSLADRFSRRQVSISANVVSGIALLGLLFALSLGFLPLYAVVGLIIGAAGSVAATAEYAWFSSIVERRLAETEIAKRSSSLMLAKLIGMGSGPILFSSLGAWALLVDALSYLLVASLLLSTSSFGDGRATQGVPQGWSKNLKGYPSIARRALFPLMAAVCSGFLMSPLMNALTQVIHRELGAKVELVSALWLIGALGSLTSNGVISKVGIRNRVFVLGMASSLMILSLLSMGLVRDEWLFVVTFVGVTLSNPWVTTLINAEVLRATHREDMGRMSALQGMGMDLATLAGVFAYSFFSLHEWGAKGIWFFVPIIVIRFVLGIFALRQKKGPPCADLA